MNLENQTETEVYELVLNTIPSNPHALACGM